MGPFLSTSVLFPVKKDLISISQVCKLTVKLGSGIENIWMTLTSPSCRLENPAQVVSSSIGNDGVSQLGESFNPDFRLFFFQAGVFRKEFCKWMVRWENQGVEKEVGRLCKVRWWKNNGTGFWESREVLFCVFHCGREGMTHHSPLQPFLSVHFSGY